MLFKNTIKAVDRFNNSRPALNRMLILLCSLGVMCVSTFARLISESKWYALSVAGGCCISVVFFLAALRSDRVKPTKSGYFLLGVEMVLGLAFILNGLLLRVVAYCIIGVVFAFLIPMLQYAFATTDQRKLLEGCCLGIVAAYLLLIAATMAFGPVLKDFKYAGLLGNKNLLGYFMAVTCPACSYLMMREGISFKARAIYLGLLTSSIAMLLFTSSRTSTLAVLAELIFLFIPAAVSRKKKNGKKLNKKRLGIYLLVAVLAPIILFFMLSTVRKTIIDIVHRPSSSHNSSNDSDSSDSDSSDDSSSDEDDDTNFSFYYYGKGVFSHSGDEDDFTSGRLTIWKTFAKNIGVKGHATETLPIKETWRVYENTNAHNVYLQVSYSAGVIAGAAYLVFVVFTGFSSLFWFIKVLRKKVAFELEHAMAICFMIGFAVISLTSDGYMVYNYYPATMFWFMAYRFIFKKSDKSETTEELPEGDPAEDENE